MSSFLILMSLVAGLGLLLWGCSPATPPTKPASGAKPNPPITASKITAMDQDQVRSLLRRLDLREEAELMMGAMCYALAGPPNRVDYACPACGEKTVYEGNMNQFITFELPQIRSDLKLVRRISRLDITLDEKCFCQKCRPANVTEPTLILKVSYPDGQVHQVPGITWQDLAFLRDFFRKKLTWASGNDDEYSLKLSLPRIQQLLGVKLEP